MCEYGRKGMDIGSKMPTSKSSQGD